MAEFIPRTKAPSKDNKYYYSSNNRYYSNNYGMPNCTAYAYGRFNELQGKYTNDLYYGDAENWYVGTTAYKKGQVPKLGAIICWKSGNIKDNSDGAGHVAIVEKILENGNIITSNSAYKGTEFYTRTLTPPNYYMGDSYEFQGFIYNPIDFEEEGETMKFKIGDKVIINGNLYRSSTTDTISGKVENRITEITRVAPNGKHPYNTTGDLGWMNETNITLYEEQAIDYKFLYEQKVIENNQLQDKINAAINILE